jgi:phosphoesterase RecJ-like protein
MKVLPAGLDALCRRMRAETGVALAVHEKPDADALGAAAGMLDLFRQLGAEARLYVTPGETLPLEGFLLPGDAVVRAMPAAGLPLYALDCGAQPRLALERTEGFSFLVDIDHHHDNTRFGDLVYVRGEASSTSEMVCDVARALGLAPSPPAAAALYAGISFDTGHFRHASTGAHTFATAAWLVRLGVDVTAVYGELYERRSPAALRLWARAVLAAEPVADGRGLVSRLLLADYAAAGAHESETEGIVESLRAAGGVEVAALVKEQTDGKRVRVSLRSGGLDVSAVAALRGGGGHRMAAGFSSDDDPGEVAAWLSSELARRLRTASS